MTTPKKISYSPNSSYKLEAAARRARVASAAVPIAGEVKPEQGRIRVTLGSKPISKERLMVIFGPSAIDIPEFSSVRKRKAP